MKGSDLLRLVDQMHHDKNIKRDVIFEGIEAAIQLAAQKHFGEESDVNVTIDRDSGQISVLIGEEEVDPSVLGRIPAQSAKNVMIQKIREAESTAVFNEYTAQKGELVNGEVRRQEPGATIVALGKTEAILPKSEQIPGDTYHINDRIKAVILEVRKVGQRVKIVLSRTHADFVRRLFENEIPEIEERIIEIKAVAREAGYRTKIAVSSIDLKVDCVGACVGVRGSRIRNIVDELGGERIDIVRWNDSLQVMIPNALQPAEIEEVFLYPRPGRTIVLVREDQLSLAIGRRGQNVRLASKLVGWDIEIMTHEELNESIEKAEAWFQTVPHVTDEMVEVFIEEGFMSFDDLSFCDPADLVELTGVTPEQAEEIIDYAEQAAERIEQGEEIGVAPTSEGKQVSEQVEADEEMEAPAEAMSGSEQETGFAAGDAVPADDVVPADEGVAADDVVPAADIVPAEDAVAAEDAGSNAAAAPRDEDGSFESHSEWEHSPQEKEPEEEEDEERSEVSASTAVESADESLPAEAETTEPATPRE